MPLTAICNAEYSDARQRQLFKNIVYLGALSALLDIDPDEIDKLFGEQYKGKEALLESNRKALRMGRDYALANFACPLPIQLRARNAVGDRIFIDGNSRGGARRRVRRRDRGRVVSDHAVVVARRGVPEVLPQVPHRPGDAARSATRSCRPRTSSPSIGMVIGAAWNGARAFTATSGPGVSLMQEFLGLAYFAEIPAVLFDVQRGSPSTGMPTRTQQADLLSCAYASHGDTKHVMLLPEDPRECFDFGRAGVRPRRPAADADLRHARPRHRHAGLAVRAVRVGRRRSASTAARS